MYLSRVEINPKKRKTMVALSSPKILHGAIEYCFPSSGNTIGRILWRIDKIGRALYIIVLSNDKPDFAHVMEQFGWEGNEKTIAIKDYDAFLDKVKAGQKYNFRLKANPTHSVKSADGSGRGKVFPHVSEKWQKKWMENKADANGFSLLEYQIVSRGNVEFWKIDAEKKHTEKKHRVELVEAIYEGILEVTDLDKFSTALKGGIGRAKAYGFGLLTIIPVD